MFDPLVVSVDFVVDGVAPGRFFFFFTEHFGVTLPVISASSLHTHLSFRNSIATV
jgi:hypothetical protein